MGCGRRTRWAGKAARGREAVRVRAVTWCKLFPGQRRRRTIPMAEKTLPLQTRANRGVSEKHHRLSHEMKTPDGRRPVLVGYSSAFSWVQSPRVPARRVCVWLNFLSPGVRIKMGSFRFGAYTKNNFSANYSRSSSSTLRPIPRGFLFLGSAVRYEQGPLM